MVELLSNVRRNDFVVNNSLMSIDRPKVPYHNVSGIAFNTCSIMRVAYTKTIFCLGLKQQIQTQERQFMRKCYKQRCATETAKDTYAV